MKKCAVYQTDCFYGDGLAFIPLEFEQDWLLCETWHSAKWHRLGDMEVDENVIKFRKEGKHSNPDSPLHKKEILVADYSYCE